MLLGIIIGIFIGGFLGVSLMCLMFYSRDDEPYTKDENENNTEIEVIQE